MTRPQGSSGAGGLSRALRFAPVLALLLLPYALMRFPAARDAGARLLDRMRAGGVVGALALVGFDVAWALLSAPYWVMGTIAGYAFGFPWGIFYAIPAATLAMSVAFVAGRVALARVLPSDDRLPPRVVAVRRAVEADGYKIALLLRMTPILPQNVLTYVFATTRLRVGEMARATALGLVPLTLFYVYAGSLVDDGAAILAGRAPDVGPLRWVMLGGGLFIGAIAMWVIARVARRALEKAMAEAEARGAGATPPARTETESQG